MTIPPDAYGFGGDPYVAPQSQGAPAAASVATGARPQIAYAAAQLVGGQLVAQLGPPDAGSAWEVRRITVSCTDAASFPAAYVYVGQDTGTANLASGTNSGAFDENDTNTPLFVPEGAKLLVAWTTATGSAGVRIEYTEV